MNTTIRFKRLWRGRVVGQIERGFDYGLAATLVQRGVAEWLPPEREADSAAPPAASSVSKGQRKR